MSKLDLSSLLQMVSFLYVALPLVFLLLAGVMWLLKKGFSNNAWVKIGEFSKWYIVSVALVFSGNLVKDGFTERETGIKEVQVYDKYVDLILEADNIDKRWKLTEYFAVVTPTERLRERWVAYQDTIRDDYLEYLKLSEEDSVDIKDLKRNAYDQPLISSTNRKFRVDIFFLEKTQATTKGKADKIAIKLAQLNYEVKVKMLRNAKNATPGYSIQHNEIRAEPSELVEAKYLQSIIGVDDFQLKTINYRTPNYLSVFVLD